MQNYLKKTLGLLISCLGIMQASYAVTIDKIVLFGDSLSDNGNLYYLLASAHRIVPFVPTLPKSPPYSEGRFSNGPVWVEKIANNFNVPLVDYAYGGAWAEPIQNSWRALPFDIGTQVSFYSMASLADFNKKNHLYIIWAGSNDYLQSGINAEDLTNTVVASIKRQIDWLSYLGAKQFLILGVPDFSHVPGVVEKGDEYAAVLKEKALMHNKKLADMVEEERKNHPDSLFIAIDVNRYFDDVIEHPAKFNLTNVSDSCYQGDFMLNRTRLVNDHEVKAIEQQIKVNVLANPSLEAAYFTAKLAENGAEACEHPEAFLFWDRLHPTTAMHQVIADLMMVELEKYGVVRRA
ncbi:MAG: SGNH/GDSL hydrolase family protein [Gammaproteobacteria bacterium]